MAHSYKVHYFHWIWSIKERKPYIDPEVQPKLYAYMFGILKNNHGELLEIGGMQEHVHLLVELKNLDRYSEVIRDVKACSSLWVHKNYPNLRDFGWQKGFASYSVSFSSLGRVKEYIENQAKHHEMVSFEDEFRTFLERHNVKYDPRFIFD